MLSVFGKTIGSSWLQHAKVKAKSGLNYHSGNGHTY